MSDNECDRCHQCVLLDDCSHQCRHDKKVCNYYKCYAVSSYSNDCVVTARVLAKLCRIQCDDWMFKENPYMDQLHAFCGSECRLKKFLRDLLTDFNPNGTVEYLQKQDNNTDSDSED